MSALLKLERDFLGCMLDNRLDMAGQVVGTERAGAEERVKVYVDGYRLRLLEVLQDNFTGLHTLLGDEAFDQLGRAYIDAHPSTHPSVRWFSQYLADFLRMTPPYDAQPYLAEMAAFEWTQGLVFDAADAPTTDIQALAAVAPDAWAGLRFQLHPTVRFLTLEWNVPGALQVLEAGEAPELRQADAPACWLLWRKDLLTHWRSLDEDEAWALDAVQKGKNFGELCEDLCRWHESSAVAMQAASFLKRWLTDGCIAHIDTPSLRGHA